MVKVWNSGLPSTIPGRTSCPALAVPRNGVISPPSCTQGASSYGTICHLRCNIGFTSISGMMNMCMNGWTLGNVLECKTIFGNQFNGPQSPWQSFLQGPNHIPFPVSTAVQRQSQSIRPYIRCPESVVILLDPRQSTAQVTLQRPVTNVDYRNVIASPAWAKQLRGNLPVGVHRVTFRARDPVSQQTAACETDITIKHHQVTPNPFTQLRPARLPEFNDFTYTRRQPFARRSESLMEQGPARLPLSTPTEERPSRNEGSENTRIDLGSSKSNFCPDSFEVHLKENQNLRSVLWQEPSFEGKLLKIYKSSVCTYIHIQTKYI